MDYSIGEAAKRIGVAPSTLRYYDKEGLLPEVKRTSGGIRSFSEADFRWLSLIECMKKAGMTILEIKKYLSLMKEGDATIPERLALFEGRKAELERQIEELKETKKVLEYKAWFYQRAKEIGSVDKVKETPVELVPKEFRKRFLDSFEPKD